MNASYARRLPTLAAVVALIAFSVVGFVPSPATAASAAPPVTPPGNGQGHWLHQGLRAQVLSEAPTTPSQRRAAAPRVVASEGLSTGSAAHLSAADITSNTVAVNGARSNFSVTFDNAPDPSNTDTTPAAPWTQAAENAFTAALQYWANRVYSSVTIVVAAHWSDLNFISPSILGSAGPNDILTPGNGTAYPEALANSLAERKIESGPDIVAEFNSGYANWYTGADPTQVTTSLEDLQSVVTHEIGHGLGFISSLGFDSPDGCSAGRACFASTPLVFDQLMTTGTSGGHLLVGDGNNSTQLTADAVSDNVYWAGRFGSLENSSTRPKLFAPSPWAEGSSGAHLDETAYPAGSGNALMTPLLHRGEIERAEGPIVTGMMNDIGWAGDDTFLKALYQSFLGRQPTAGEVAAGEGTLKTEFREQVALDLANSPEWLTGIITDFYKNTLNRAPDSGGLAFWINQIQTGKQTVATTAANFYGSPEYFQKTANSSFTTWVTDLYSALLGRQPDQSGLAFWAQQAQVQGLGWVALTFYQSQESREDRVKALYSTLLGRAPDPGGLSFWADQILTKGDLSLAANLAGSDEFGQNAEYIYFGIGG